MNIKPIICFLKLFIYIIKIHILLYVCTIVLEQGFDKLAISPLMAISIIRVSNYEEDKIVNKELFNKGALFFLQSGQL